MSEWERMCREEVAAARHDSTRRYWSRRLWWARWGHIAAAPLGLSLGITIGLAVVHFVN